MDTHSQGAQKRDSLLRVFLPPVSRILFVCLFCLFFVCSLDNSKCNGQILIYKHGCTDFILEVIKLINQFCNDSVCRLVCQR